MYDFFTHEAVLVWSIILTIIGWIILLAFAGLVIHEIYVVAGRIFNNPNNNEENS